MDRKARKAELDGIGQEGIPIYTPNASGGYDKRTLTAEEYKREFPLAHIQLAPRSLGQAVSRAFKVREGMTFDAAKTEIETGEDVKATCAPMLSSYVEEARRTVTRMTGEQMAGCRRLMAAGKLRTMDAAELVADAFEEGLCFGLDDAFEEAGIDLDTGRAMDKNERTYALSIVIATVNRQKRYKSTATKAPPC